jgi:hypothetical protein
MKFKFKHFFLIFFLFSCVEDVKLINRNNIQVKKTFISKGFTLIYNDNLIKEKTIKKRIDSREYVILHSFLKRNTYVKIFNPINSKTVIAKVKYKTNYPIIYNSVITNRIAEELELNYEDPYVEIIEIRKNDTFIVKKAKTFDEEKNVANKAPVTDININVISNGTENTEISSKKNEYIINIGEYYYLDSAKVVKNRLINEANLTNVKIKKISKNKFRVYVGSYYLFNAMKNPYFAISKLGFEHLDVIKIN